MLAGRPAAAQQSASVLCPVCPSASEPRSPSAVRLHLCSPRRRTRTSLCCPAGHRAAHSSVYRRATADVRPVCQPYRCGGSRSVLNSGQSQSHVGICGRGEPLEAVQVVGATWLGNSHCLCASAWAKWGREQVTTKLWLFTLLLHKVEVQKQVNTAGTSLDRTTLGSIKQWGMFVLTNVRSSLSFCHPLSRRPETLRLTCGQTTVGFFHWPRNT